jgi:hypothetical protein
MSTGIRVTASPCRGGHRVGLGEGERREQATLLGLQREHRDERQRDDQQREEQGRADLDGGVADDLPARLAGQRLARVRLVPSLEVLVRVLDHHHGGIDHGADGDGDPAERHDVGVDALLLHDDEGGQDAERQRDDGDERRAQVEQEGEADERDDEELLEELAAEVLHRALDQPRAVVHRHDLDALRQARTHGPRSSP